MNDNDKKFDREIEINSLDDYIRAISERASDEKTLIKSQINYLKGEKEKLEKLNEALPPDNIRIPPYVTLISLKLSKLNDPNLLNLLYDVMTKEAPEDILSRFKGKVTLPLFRAIFKIGESDLYNCKEITERFIELLRESCYYFSQTDLNEFTALLNRFTSETESYQILKKEIGTLPYGLLIGTKITKQEYLNEVNNANKIKDFNELAQSRL